MTDLGKNEMKPKADVPWSVRFSEGLGRSSGCRIGTEPVIWTDRLDD